MAKYDQGGGCACGLRKVCDCKEEVMTKEYKTLRELDVQPGDVVENKTGVQEIIIDITDGAAYSTGGYPWFLDNPVWRIVSRASDTPKPLRDMTDAEIGALVRAKNEGKVIECFVDRFGWYEELYTTFDPDIAYRAVQRTKRETVVLRYNGVEDIYTVSWADGSDCTINLPDIAFDLIDGNMPAGTYISEDGHTITVEEL